MNLRPYQQKAIEDLSKGFKANQRQVLCAPTGSGKTVIFSEIVRRASLKNTQCLILTDRVELFKQTCKTLSMRVQELNAKTHIASFDHLSLVTVGMVETLKRRVLFGYEPKLIIVDEAHKGNFNKVFELYPNSLVIGATATPVGKHFYKYYQDIVTTIDIPELIEEGYLSNCRAYQMQDDFSDLETKAGEYTDKSLFNHFNNRKLYSGVVDEWLKRCEGKKTIVFNVNIEHSEMMTEEFNNRGINSECITSKTSDAERERILKAFKDGYFPVLNNCGILTTGYDEPSIEVVVMNRKTKSLPLWLQCCGRGSRIYPNKEYFTILDFGQNHDEHGMWSEPREWIIAPPKNKKQKQQAAPVKVCKVCDALNFASARVCVACKNEFEITKQEEVKGVMVEMTPKTPDALLGKKISDLTIDELIVLQKSKKYKASFIWRVVRSIGEVALNDYAKKMNYGQGWVYRQCQQLNESNYKNYQL
jgi:superfamily II DNA or RNA helicase